MESISVIGASWFLLPTDGNALPQVESLKILVMQVTTTGAISGSLNYQMFPEGNQDSSLQYVHTFNGEGMFEGEVYIQLEGCQDESACNYDPDANFQPLDACNFPDECGVCDGEELVWQPTEIAIATETSKMRVAFVEVTTAPARAA